MNQPLEVLQAVEGGSEGWRGLRKLKDLQAFRENPGGWWNFIRMNDPACFDPVVTPDGPVGGCADLLLLLLYAHHSNTPLLLTDGAA